MKSWVPGEIGLRFTVTFFSLAFVASVALSNSLVPIASAQDQVFHGGIPVQLLAWDFFRGSQGQSRIILRADREIPEIHVNQHPGFLTLDLIGAVPGPQLLPNMDVADFLTPVKSLSVQQRSPLRLQLDLAASGSVYWRTRYEGTVVVLEIFSGREYIHPVADREQAPGAQQGISLDVQDMDIHVILRLFAEFTGINIIATSQVSGRLTIRLQEVPWERAFELLLETLDLTQQRQGNVILVRPRTEYEAREKERLRQYREIRELEPVQMAILRLKHGKAEDFRDLLAAQERGGNGDTNGQQRGSLHVDTRTNTLIIFATRNRIDSLTRLIEALDIPTPQVLVETRIVIAEDVYLKDLGSRFGVSGSRHRGDFALGISGQMEAARELAATADRGLFSGGELPQRLNWALPIPPAGSGAVSILRRGVGLDVELRALEEQGRGEILANPRIVTSSGRQASISDGNQIPYRTLTEAGAVGDVRLIPANLSTEVTPLVTPSGQIVLQIRITKDEPNFALVVDGQPAIRGRSIDTQVVVNDGETVVLGGIFEQSSQSREQRIPVLGDVPLFGRLFRNQVTSSGNAELAVFVTPYILP